MVADGFAIRATGMKTAAGRRMDRAGNVALKNGALLLPVGIGDGNRRKQSARVRMLCVPIDRIALGDLDDLAEVHDRYSMTDVLDHPEIMRNEKIG